MFVQRNVSTYSTEGTPGKSSIDYKYLAGGHTNKYYRHSQADNDNLTALQVT